MYRHEIGSWGRWSRPERSGQKNQRPKISYQGHDPNGIGQHEAGAKLDMGKNRLGLVSGHFARALWHVGLVGTYGANKYTDNGWISVADGINRYSDAGLRHYLRRMMGEEYDEESKLLHLAHEAWNALAQLELYLREQEKK